MRFFPCITKSFKKKSCFNKDGWKLKLSGKYVPFVCVRVRRAHICPDIGEEQFNNK